jgi:hypothetical protein
MPPRKCGKNGLGKSDPPRAAQQHSLQFKLVVPRGNESTQTEKPNSLANRRPQAIAQQTTSLRLAAVTTPVARCDLMEKRPVILSLLELADASHFDLDARHGPPMYRDWQRLVKYPAAIATDFFCKDRVSAKCVSAVHTLSLLIEDDSVSIV